MADSDDVPTTSGTASGAESIAREQSFPDPVPDVPVEVPGGEEPSTGEKSSVGRALRSRFAGFLALALGVVGVVASVVFAVLVVRAGFGAGSAIDSILAPVSNTLDRIDTRIDQADDDVDRDGVPVELMPTLRARSEGLLDVASSGRDLFTTVEDHPIYQWLPAEMGPLGESLTTFSDGANNIEDLVSGTAENRPLSATDAGVIADEIDVLQAEVAGAGEALDNAARSLKRWLRLGALFAFLASLWSGWAQYCLARRGARALRGRPV